MSQAIFDQRQGGFRVFIGNLSSRTNISDLEYECERYGPLVKCWIARNPSGFAFVLFKNGEDAELAVRNLNGYVLGGQRIRVEHAKARSINSRNAPSYDQYHREERSRSKKKSKSSHHRHRSRSRHRRTKSKSSSDSESSHKN